MTHRALLRTSFWLRPGILVAVLLGAAAALLGGCSPQRMVESLVDDAKGRIAEDYLRRVAAGDSERLLAELESPLQTPGARAEIEKMRTLLPTEAPKVKNVVGYQSHFNADGTALYNITFQMGYGTRWVLANAAWRELKDGQRVIAGLTVRPLPEPLEVTHAFSFTRARPLHYLILAAAIGVAGFIVATLVVCVRTPIRRRKWLWVLFILVGITQVSLNWTTGDVSIRLSHLSLLGAGALRASAYSPWMISVGVPLGAIIFWCKRRTLGAPPRPQDPAVLPPATPVP